MPYVEADEIQCLYGCMCCNVYHAYVLVSPKNEVGDHLKNLTHSLTSIPLRPLIWQHFRIGTLDPKCRRGAPKAGRSYYNKYKYKFIKRVIIIFQVFYKV